MQFLRTPKERAPPSPGAALGAGGGSPYELSMYKDPPAGEVALEEFEKLALARLRGARARAGAFRPALLLPCGTVCARKRPAWPRPTVLKALEESRLRSKTDEVIQDEVTRRRMAPSHPAVCACSKRVGPVRPVAAWPCVP